MTSRAPRPLSRRPWRRRHANGGPTITAPRCATRRRSPLLLKESGLPGDKLERLLAAMPGADLSADTLSTQEQSWAASAGAVLGRDGTPARIAVDGKRPAAGAGGVGCARVGRPLRAIWRMAGVAGGLGNRRAGNPAAGGPVTDAHHPPVRDAGRAAARSRSSEAEHGVRAGAGGQGGGWPGRIAPWCSTGCRRGGRSPGGWAAAMCRAWRGSASCRSPRLSPGRTTAMRRWWR